VRVALHPEARAEIREAALWYDEQRPGLGEEFVAAVSSTLDRIGQLPSSFPTWPAVPVTPVPIRRAMTKRFPYALAFELHPEHVAVLAVAHMKRRPLYWLARAYQ
jgi:toxin ParE1/3/4